MSVPVYKELDKSATDLITKGFSTDHGIEIEGSAESIKFKATATHTAEALNALLETTKVCASKGCTVKASVKSEKNEPVYAFEVAYEPKNVEGLKVTFNSECKTPASGQVDVNKLTVLYKRGDRVTVEDSIAYSKGKLTLTGSVAFAYEAVRAGAHALATVGLEEKKFALGAFGFKLGYAPSKALTLVANFEHCEKKGDAAGATLFYKKDSTEAAGQVTIDPKKPAEVPAFTLALSHAHDAKTTLKAKLATKQRTVGLSLKHQITEALAVTFTSECGGPCCPHKAEEGKAASTHKHGVALNLKL